MAIKGRNLRVYTPTASSEGLDKVKIAGERSCKLTIKCDSKEVASVTSGIWKEFKAGRISWQVTASALLTADPTRIRNMMLSRTPIYLWFENADEDTAYHYEGYAIITEFEQSGEIKGYATYSVTFKGTGVLSFEE